MCDCCNQPMHVMGEEIREELELIPELSSVLFELPW
ncbi:IS66 family transposase zinc-finger binding domain-containing protein [Klebsiella pneumoniae]